PTRKPVREARAETRRRDQERQRPGAHQHGRRDAPLPAIRQRPARAGRSPAPGPQRDALLRHALSAMTAAKPIAALFLATALAPAARPSLAQAPDQQTEQQAPPGTTAPEAPQPGPPAGPVPPAPSGIPGPTGVRPPGTVAVTPRSGEVLLNFQQADLQAVVKA